MLVTGGRNYDDKNKVFLALLEQSDARGNGCVLLCGMARGADSIAYQSAIFMGWPVEKFYADWDRYGKRAGPLRNIAMADAKPDVCLAFPGGRGTAHMVSVCIARGIPVINCG